MDALTLLIGLMMCRQIVFGQTNYTDTDKKGDILRRADWGGHYQVESTRRPYCTQTFIDTNIH